MDCREVEDAEETIESVRDAYRKLREECRKNNEAQTEEIADLKKQRADLQRALSEANNKTREHRAVAAAYRGLVVELARP